MPELFVLTDLEVGEVSLVQHGANRKRIALAKSEVDNVSSKNATLKSALETACKLEEQIKLEGPEGDAARVALRALSAFDNAEIKSQVAKALGLANEQSKPAPTGEITKADLEAARDPEMRTKLEAVLKSQDELKARVEKAEADRIVAEKRMRDESRAAVRKSLLVKTELQHAPGTPEAKADLILAVTDANPELGAQVEAALVAASAAIAKSELFKSLGNPGKASNARAELENRAAELRKTNTAMSIQKARVTVLYTDPSLRARIREEA